MSETPKKEPGTCEVCGKAPASIHIRHLTAGKEVELRLCPSCAQERGVDAQVKSSGLTIDPVALMFQGMQETAESTGTCPGCDMNFSRFRETGRVGCAQCYETFAAELEPLLRRVHGSTGHTGKVPVREGEAYEARARLRRLNEDLERAIHAEDYERAAEIRDLIQSLETATAPPGN